jgi:methionyl-tRNA synthetase
MRSYVTTAIPYVNGDPHLGHALELVQGDVLARHRRLRGDDVRFLSGTDDNALKNVEAAVAAGIPVGEYVSARAARFEELAATLDVSLDDFIRTSSDPRHRPGVERLWRACAEAGDLYERDYVGRYCVGCEAFVDVDPCPEHGTSPEEVAERNWFFRLSRHADALRELLESGRLRVEPEQRRNEVLALVRDGLEDFSVSRSRERARGWGIPVPGDPEQVVYVWFDALANYVTALGYGSGAEPFDTWWRGSDGRIHVIGKGIVRFHALYWPAILLSAGERVPSTIVVHDYITVDGRKISKSRGNGAAPEALVERYGADAVRWWLVRDVPRVGDADFREELLARRANELADGLGNLVNRTVALAVRQAPAPAGLRLAEAEALPGAIDAALRGFDLRAAAAAVWEVVAAGNRYVAETRPWELEGRRRDEVLCALLDACATIAHELEPFLPAAAARARRVLAERDLALGRTLFARFPAASPAPTSPDG